MTSNTTAAPSVHAEGVIRHIDPAELVIDDNIRTETLDLSKGFLDSIADGIRQPVLAIEVDGKVIVQDGQRRTLAARERGLATIPVYVLPATADAKTRTQTRLVDQYVANTQRTNLSASEAVAAIEQMALAGMSATKIAKSVRTSKKTVDHMLTAATSTAATEALSDGALTLEQAATLALYDGDDDATERLLNAANRGRFDHAAQRLADTVEERALVRAKIAELADTGIAATATQPPYNHPATALHRLVTADGTAATIDDVATEHRLAYVYANDIETWTDADGTEIDGVDVDTYLDVEDPDATPEEGLIDPRTLNHTREIVVEIDWYVADSDAAGLAIRSHSSSSDAASPVTEAQKDADKEQRRRTIALNKQATTATEVRRTKLREYLARKSVPKGKAGAIAEFVADTMWHHHDLLGLNRQDGNAKSLAVDLLGGNLPSQALDGASVERRHIVTLAIAIAAHEADMPKDAWRDVTKSWAGHRATYLRMLTDVFGYTLADVEQVITGDLDADTVDLD